MNASLIWMLMAGVAVAAELLTGTFYLLMLAFGMVFGAGVAWMGFSGTAQSLVAALVGGGAVAVWHQYRRNRYPKVKTSTNRDINLDIGETVQVDTWQADGTATVKYRGAQWTVTSPLPASTLAPGAHRVTEVIGSRLIVEKII